MVASSESLPKCLCGRCSTGEAHNPLCTPPNKEIKGKIYQNCIIGISFLMWMLAGNYSSTMCYRDP